MNSRVKFNVGTSPEPQKLLENIERVRDAVDKLEMVADTECQFSGALRAIACMAEGDGSSEGARNHFEALRAGDLVDLFNLLADHYDARMSAFSEHYSLAFRALKELRNRTEPPSAESTT